MDKKRRVCKHTRIKGNKGEESRTQAEKADTKERRERRNKRRKIDEAGRKSIVRRRWRRRRRSRRKENFQEQVLPFSYERLGKVITVKCFKFMTLVGDPFVTVG